MRQRPTRVRWAARRRTPQHLTAAALATRFGWWRQHVAQLVLLDAVAVTAATVASRVLSFGFDPAELEVRNITIPYLALAVAIVPAWLAILAMTGCYDVGPFGATTTRIRCVVRAGANLLAVVAVAYYILHLEHLARGFFATLVPLAVGFTIALRPLARAHLRARRLSGYATRRAVVAGSRGAVGQVITHATENPTAGLVPIAACVPGDPHRIATTAGDIPVVGGSDDVLDALRATAADTLIVAGGLPPGRVRSLAWELEGSGIDVLVVPAAAPGSRLDVRPVADLPLVYLDRLPDAAMEPIP